MKAIGRLGGLLLMVRRSLRQHALSSLVTILAVGLASGLAMSVFAVQRQASEAFINPNVGFDAVMGARGSPLQLVLNTVFHLETSLGNIPWKMYEDIRKRPTVSLAIPYAVGDNFRGFRIVGTSEQLFTEFEYQSGRKFRVAYGRFFDPTRREAVIGSFAAAKTGLRVGDTFNPYHGLTFDPSKKHDDEYTVVGVLEATNSPSDRVIWIPIEGIFRMTGHVLRGDGSTFQPQAGQSIPDEHKEVSAVMLKLKSQMAGMNLGDEINKRGTAATLAWPIGAIMGDLFNKFGWVSRVLELIAYLVVLVAAGTILAALYNTMNERRREFAILRALGAGRGTVFSVVVLEATAIAALGALAGVALNALVLSVVAVVLRDQTGVVIDVFKFHPALIAVPIGMIVLGALAGIIPALKAYSTPVAEGLTPPA